MKKIFTILFKWLLRIALVIIGLVLIGVLYFKISTRIEEPQIKLGNLKEMHRTKLNDSTYRFNHSFLRKNAYGIWEMYLEGSPEEIGYSHGVLAQELMSYQEKAFVDQIQTMIPDPSYLRFLKYVTAFMNRNLPDYIPLEYQREIKAVSLFADPKYSFIGDNYERQLNYHAAHDIGHAMQNLNLVACTAFSVWDSLSVDSDLLIARNFDFYVGDEFAKNKVLFFVAPDSGYRFVSVAWAGMSGVVSGMNEQGVSVSLNASKSDIPFSAKTPVSIIAREIVQYAKSINEAYAIALKHPSFVAETFFIGSANDGQTAIIEKTPDTTILLRVTDLAQQVLTNHFQSPELLHQDLNQQNLNDNATGVRYKRVEELLSDKTLHTLDGFAEILRNPFGLHDALVGWGNEDAVNQFVAHHSIILKPQKQLLWIASNPFQLGAYHCFYLDTIFQNPELLFNDQYQIQRTIPADSVQLSTTYRAFSTYKQLKERIEKAIQTNMPIDDQSLLEFQQSNPDYFYTWEMLGDYYLYFKETEKACKSYKKALERVIPNRYERERIVKKQTQLSESSF